ncbi:putative nuclease HARBI1 [Microcaecilia unicolor]|uniref:Putative nuclease HARBI1 n=1 Tax=Microcaecilia unicolor TaxID=1415580 RepID=A0A6P7Y6F5_9AMPH|nr:putative nuclease HARBI1 [Microcaecilia unicolor]
MCSQAHYIPCGGRGAEEDQAGILQDCWHALGAIDCTHVAFTPPMDQEIQYRNRKMGYSLNVQVVCDANLRILDVVLRYLGSCHDSYILSNSAMGKKFAKGEFGQGWLLGDAGYGSKTWLLTLLTAPCSEAENCYESHILTRCTIERTFGALKSRFCCLHLFVGSLQYSPDKVADIVTMCCMLHNIVLKHRLEINIVLPPEVDITPLDRGSDVTRRNAVQQQLIREYFGMCSQLPLVHYCIVYMSCQGNIYTKKTYMHSVL